MKLEVVGGTIVNEVNDMQIRNLNAAVTPILETSTDSLKHSSSVCHVNGEDWRVSKMLLLILETVKC